MHKILSILYRDFGRRYLTAEPTGRDQEYSVLDANLIIRTMNQKQLNNYSELSILEFESLSII